MAESSRGALKQGLQAILASGAHATYDEDEPASVISAQIERALAMEGVTVLPCYDVSFGERPNWPAGGRCESVPGSRPGGL